MQNQKGWLFSTWCDNQCLSFVGVLLDKALKAILPENYGSSLLGMVRLGGINRLNPCLAIDLIENN